VPADLVVDAMGRNTTVDKMLAGIGAHRPEEQSEDLGSSTSARCGRGR
jgi:hypothetical protein